jgi:enamine deaminase RidA (YjgF/YER057c/UK114 family)
MDHDKRIDELFLDIPEAPAEKGASTAHAVKTGRLVFLSGVLPWKEGRLAYKGRVGLELTLDTGKLAAHAACVQALGILRHFLDGSLNSVKQIVLLKGFVASGAEFKEHQKVLDGASKLLTDIFGGTAGRHARTAVGVNALPGGAAVELEMIVEVR